MAAAGPVTQDGLQTQMGPGSTFTQSFSGFSQDGYGLPRDYDFKSQDSLQSDSLYLTQQFPAYQTQVGCKCCAHVPVQPDFAAGLHECLATTLSVALPGCHWCLLVYVRTWMLSLRTEVDSLSVCH